MFALEMEELELVDLLKSRDEKSFRRFFSHFYDTFFRIAYYYLQNSHDAQEIVLDAFMKIRNLTDERLSEIQNIDSYCFTLVKNESLNFLSTRKPFFMTLEPIGEHPSYAQPSPEKKLLEKELLETYVSAMRELPEKCREAFILVKEQQLSYAEAAKRMNVSTKTIDNHLQKAIRHIKTKINAYFLGST